MKSSFSKGNGSSQISNWNKSLNQWQTVSKGAKLETIKEQKINTTTENPYDALGDKEDVLKPVLETLGKTRKAQSQDNRNKRKASDANEMKDKMEVDTASDKKK